MRRYSLNLKSILRKPTATVREGQTLSEAFQKMLAEDVGTLAVIGKNGRTVGALSERSFLMTPLNQRVRDVASGPLFFVHANADLDVEEMVETSGESKQIPIVCKDSGEFLGLLFMSDLVRALAGEAPRFRGECDCDGPPIHDG
jgi:predicted transcriptional regulator